MVLRSAAVRVREQKVALTSPEFPSSKQLHRNNKGAVCIVSRVKATGSSSSSFQGITMKIAQSTGDVEDRNPKEDAEARPDSRSGRP